MVFAFQNVPEPPFGNAACRPHGSNFLATSCGVASCSEIKALEDKGPASSAITRMTASPQAPGCLIKLQLGV